MSLRCLIAGGGIGGLALAAGLLREGFEPLVLEQAPSLQPVGAGVNLTPNAMKALTWLGVDKHVRQSGVAGDGFLGVDLESGEEIFSHPMTGQAEAEYGDKLISTYRPDLVEALMARLSPAHIRLGSAVSDIRQDDTSVRARLASGEEISGDVLIGADGLNSAVRAKLFGALEPRFTGYAAWRALIPATTAPKIPRDSFTRTYMGDGRHIVFYPVHRGEIFNFAGFVPADEITRESWNVAGHVSELRASYAAACVQVQDILAPITQAFVTGIYFRDALPAWTSGRITLLGDAAHPVPPSAAQGASMAIEDAVTLAICLRRFGRQNFSAAFADYQQRRIPVAQRVLIQARSNLRLYNEPDPVQRRARQGFYCGLAQLDPLADAMRGWMYRGNAITAAEKSIAEFERETTTPNPLRSEPARDAFTAWQRALTPEDNADGWVGQRVGYERFATARFKPANNVRSQRITCNDVPALRVVSDGRSAGPAVLYLHGGAYTMGSAQGSIDIAARIAAAVNGWALIPDYRLAPEHPFPAAHDDALAAYRWLTAHHDKTQSLYIVGDDAGGALAVAVAIAAAKEKLRRANALYLISPFCDLNLASRSIGENGPIDPWYKRNSLILYAARYIQNADLRDLRLSVLNADLSGLPPLLIHAAREETLRDDAVRFAEVAKKAGVNVNLSLFNDTVHAFPLFAELPETVDALSAWSAFAESHP